MNALLEAPHALSSQQVCSALSTDPRQGLTEDEAEARLKIHGRNVLQTSGGNSAWKLLMEQFQNILILILLGATGLSAILGHATESIAIAVIVLFAVGLGFVQEFRAEKALQSLKKLAAPLSAVLRGGKERTISTELLVPGDILLLTTGKRVGADARIVESLTIKADEAPLTGESVPVEKCSEALQMSTALAERRNLVFAGTNTVYGRGKAVVYATGMQTEFGKIASLLAEVELEDTPLQKELKALGNMLAKGAFGIVIVVSALGWLRGESLISMILFGIALAVAVVPEALPAVVTISLAIGVQRMVKRHALVRRLSAVETLGCTTVICTDKTGTLTKDEMTARTLYCGGDIVEITGSGYGTDGRLMKDGTDVAEDPVVLELLTAAALASDATLTAEEGQADINGDPTEGALVVVAAKAGLQKDVLEELRPRIAEIPFTSETKRMITLHRTSNSSVAYAKGALESILPCCSTWNTGRGVEPLTAELRSSMEEVALGMASKALRVLAVAKRETTNISVEMGEGWTFLGYFGLMDPPRPEAKSAIATCKSAGIRVVMITGDHPVTASAIAGELGFERRENAVATGNDIDACTDDTFTSLLERTNIFARVSPAHKLKIVRALQAQSQVVAMTGDGVNDAPALKQADIGLAMGIAGTDVSREASAVILTDDNFASIVAAVEEGRIIFGNIKKYLLYLLSSNIGEIGLMVGATLFGLPLPLAAVHILYVNLATDGLPALALAVDPPETDVMRHRPRDARSSLFTRRVMSMMFLSGFWSTVVNLAVFAWAMSSGRSLAESMSMCFVTLVLIQFWNAYVFRSDGRSTLRKPFANKWLNIAVAWEFLLLLAVVELPFFQRLMGTFPLTVEDWLIIAAASFTIVPAMEVFKHAWKKRSSEV